MWFTSPLRKELSVNVDLDKIYTFNSLRSEEPLAVSSHTIRWQCWHVALWQVFQLLVLHSINIINNIIASDNEENLKELILLYYLQNSSVMFSLFTNLFCSKSWMNEWMNVYPYSDRLMWTHKEGTLKCNTYNKIKTY